MNDKEESLISHLEALRKTILDCLLALCAVLPFAFYFSPKILHLLIKILVSKNKVSFNFFSPAEVFIIEIKLALLVSFVVAFPYIIKKIWDFILPALYNHERKFLKNIVFVSTFLFVFGVLFCCFAVLPLIVKFGLNFSKDNIQAMFGISNIVNLSLWMMAAFGLVFQMPVLTYFLVKLGIVHYETLADKRPYVVVILLFLAAILTPPDVISQIILFLPAYLLFEIGLLFSKGKN